MRFLKLASNKNPDNDYILLNGGYFDKDGNKVAGFSNFESFLCTSFQSLGISRKLEFLAIKNRQFTVENKPDFKKYSLTIEILSKYSEYEGKYNELITFIDKNKKDGFRLYYRPYGNDKDRIRYCLCDVESFTKSEKLQPVVLILSQNSLWLGKIEKRTTVYIPEEEKSNLFAFKKNEDIYDLIDKNGEDVESNRRYYYSSSFSLDEDINNYYCMSFYSNVETQADIKNNSYNEIPLNIRIKGACVNPVVSLFRKGENTPFRQLEINKIVDSGQYIEIISNIGENGVWLVNQNGERTPYNEFVNNEYGSPYFYIDNGEYMLKVMDDANNTCETEILYQEEFSE